ncbi:immunoglobulin-like domain-containing protein [Candidatus Izemoplasma sp. B36]|uniref:immunoglobulin-like domain-containing protein n=1 Tax=Candidatus Izemoplasma sp. B36 TaxID=3242468 RepID=UPI0035581DDF
MKGIFTKKVLVIVSVVLVIVLGAVLIAFTTGKTYYPSLSNPDEVFYQRVDESGKVLYEITNEEIFEEIKGNDGIQQLLFMVDSIILEDYIDLVTQSEIDDKILQLTYGSSNADDIAEISDEDKADLETAFDQSMILAGFAENPEGYAKLIVAREKFVLELAKENEDITDLDVVKEFYESYFEDVMAIKIRFTSSEDAYDVLEKYNLLSVTDEGLREFTGFVYDDEELLNSDDEIIEAQISVDPYYFDEDENILNLYDITVYTKNASGIYTDDDENQYTINEVSGDLEDNLSEVVIPNTELFDTKEDAETYKEDNSQYFTVYRVDPFDENEDIQIIDSEDVVQFTIDSDGIIWDKDSVDVTDTTELVVNKVFTDIEDVETATENNTIELTDEELLAKFIEMYNYVYGLYRDPLTVGASINDLVASENEDLTYNFEDMSASTPVVADYMFKELNLEDNRYTKTPKLLTTGTQSFYYLMFKLDEPTKVDVLEEMIKDIKSTISLPSEIATSIELPTESYYESTISWSSSVTALIDNEGTVTNPTADMEVDLTYTITCMGETESETITVTILASGENSDDRANEFIRDERTYQEIVNNSEAFSKIKNDLYDEIVYGDSGSSNVSTTLNEKRAELGFQIHDYYLSIDYKSQYSSYEYLGDGDKLNLATLDAKLDSEEAVIITADDFLEYTLNQNAALYTIYAAQYKEALASKFYEDVFGTERNLLKNNTDRMDDMLDQITQAKSYYNYLQSLYAQYGLEFTYNSFIDYAYSQFGVKTESDLLEYFVKAELQPYFINETNIDKDIVDALLPTVNEYFENYFSLNVSHVLAYIDFDEDGSPDDFNDYMDTLTQAEIDTFIELQARLETALDVYSGSFSELVTEFNSATRDDETWGEFKQNGFLILTEELNATDDDGVSHSLTYSGEYGVKDTFVQEYVDALILLYQEYQLPQNLDKSEMYSGLVETQFGLHLIKATQGDDFEKPIFEFAEEDSDNPVYSDGVENANEEVTVEQLELYALYKFYTMVYDLTQTDVEEKYNIDVPSFPESVTLALNTYFEDLISSTYVLGVINVNLAERLDSGEFFANTYLTVDNDTVMDILEDVGQVYFDAIFSDYITE